MIRLYVGKEERKVIQAQLPGSFMLEGAPDAGHDVYEFDEETNPILATIVNSPERDQLTVTEEGTVHWRGAEIPVAAEHEQTKRRREIEQSFKRVFTENTPFTGKDIRIVMRTLCERSGIALVNDQISGL